MSDKVPGPRWVHDKKRIEYDTRDGHLGTVLARYANSESVGMLAGGWKSCGETEKLKISISFMVGMMDIASNAEDKQSTLGAV